MSPATPRRPPTRAARVAVLVVALVVTTVDLTAKAAAEARLVGSSVDLGWVDLRLSHNTGVAFGLGRTLPAALVVTITAVVATALVLYAWRRAPYAGWVERIAGGSVIGGAVANLVDRTPDGAVTDYLHTGWWPTFNLADVFLVTGFLVIAVLQARPGDREAEPAGIAAESPASTDTSGESR